MDIAHAPLPCSAMIVAAGSSQRMGFDKLAGLLDGVTVLKRTLDAILAAESISDVIVVCPAERWELLGCSIFPKPVKRVDGGSTRQDSVAAGLAALSKESGYVAVHDGARPLVTPHDIDRCVAAAREHRAAALARRVTETLKRANAEDFTTASLSRDQLWFMETPQVFELGLLKEGYACITAQGRIVTDEVSAMEAIRIPVKLIESTSPNLKITTPTDLALAAALLQ
jgi:2-C-methyl-D-erythritol 4-phosphate cytidylyltransferase